MINKGELGYNAVKQSNLKALAEVVNMLDSYLDYHALSVELDQIEFHTVMAMQSSVMSIKNQVEKMKGLKMPKKQVKTTILSDCMDRLKRGREAEAARYNVIRDRVSAIDKIKSEQDNKIYFAVVEWFEEDFPGVLNELKSFGVIVEGVRTAYEMALLCNDQILVTIQYDMDGEWRIDNRAVQFEHFLMELVKFLRLEMHLSYVI